MAVKIPFGKRDDNLVHISELVETDRGLACNCRCIECGSKLVAKLGNNKNIRHFAHYRECSCDGGIETALHIFAKDVLSRKKEVVVPKLDIQYCNYSWSRNEVVLSHENEENTKLIPTKFKTYDDYKILKESYNREVICERQILKFDRVELEKVIGKIKPDIILYIKDRPLLIEIAVTHFVEENKRKSINDNRLSTIEIDLSKYKEKFHEMNKKDLEDIIINSTEDKVWIFNEKCEQKIKKVILQNKIKHKKAMETSLIRIEEANRLNDKRNYINNLKKKIKEERLKKDREELDYKYNILRTYRDDIIKSFRNDLFNTPIWKVISDEFSIKECKVPALIDVEIENDIIFKFDRSIWQYKIYCKVIKNKKNKCIWVNDMVKYAKLGAEVYTELVRYNGEDMIEESVRGYIDALVENGILEWRDKEGICGGSLIVLNDKLN